ncbi:MAG: cupredoxin family protein [Pseudomonadota bacterium]
MKTLNTFLCAALFSTLTAASLSTAHADESTHHDEYVEMSIGHKGVAKNVSRAITIEASEIAFDVKSIDVKAGETIRFVLINKGEQPHELALGDADEQSAHREMMSEMAGMKMEHAEGNSVSAEPGETKELIWTFTKAGTFEFACNYPGHSELGMTGPLIVK